MDGVSETSLTCLLLGDVLSCEHEVAQQGLVALHGLAQLRQAVPALGDHQKVDWRLGRQGRVGGAKTMSRLSRRGKARRNMRVRYSMTRTLLIRQIHKK